MTQPPKHKFNATAWGGVNYHLSEALKCLESVTPGPDVEEVNFLENCKADIIDLHIDLREYFTVQVDGKVADGA